MEFAEAPFFNEKGNGVAMAHEESLAHDESPQATIAVKHVTVTSGAFAQKGQCLAFVAGKKWPVIEFKMRFFKWLVSSS